MPIETKGVEITHDADQFQALDGNRPIDPVHVRRLKRSIEEQGNLTQEFPIVVNEHMQVLDGQHRLEALKELGLPIAYEVRNNLSIEAVRVINATHKNWSWLDYARSYAGQGLHSYRQLLNLYEQFGFSLRVLAYYSDSTGAGGGRSHNFYRGEFVMGDYGKGYKLLGKLAEAVEAIGFTNREFTYALKDIMENPVYDHERMVKKLSRHGQRRLEPLRRKIDFQRELEEIYNHGVSDDKRVRLF